MIKDWETAREGDNPMSIETVPAVRELYAAYIDGRIFGGKLAREAKVLEEAIEMIGLANTAKGQMVFVSIICGDLELPERAVLVKLSSRSPYYSTYFQASSGIGIVQ